MADMGFLPQVRNLLDRMPVSRQTMLWSATLDGDVDRLVRRYQREPRRHEIAPSPGADAEVIHRFWRVAPQAKAANAAGLIRHHGTGIVFVRTRHGAERVVRQLTTAGVGTAAIHGNRTQAQRERALNAFRTGAVSALVATDVAARGIHVDDVGVVIHWDPVDHHKDYVHRSGRTARAGATGVVVSLVSPDAHGKTAALQRALELPVGLDDPDDLSHADARADSASPADRTTVQAVGRPNRSARRAHRQPSAPNRRPSRAIDGTRHRRRDTRGQRHTSSKSRRPSS